MAAPNTQRPIDLAANYNAEIISICTVFAVLCLLAVVARLASRRLTGGKFAADDFLLVGSWVCTTSADGPSESKVYDFAEIELLDHRTR